MWRKFGLTNAAKKPGHPYAKKKKNRHRSMPFTKLTQSESQI